MLVVLGVAAGPERLIEKLQQKDPYAGRREYAESSLRMIRDKPLIGVGMGNWSAAYPVYATFDDGLFVNQAHNDWAQWAVEGGLPFAFLMLSVAVWSVPRSVRTVWGIGVIVVFLHCLVDYPIQRIGVAFVFFSLVAAIASPDGSRKPAEPRRSARRGV
jgi:O-antigen ligase